MILERFIAQKYLSYLFVLFFGLTGLYLLIEAFERLPDFLENQVSFLTILVYFGLISPKIIFQLSPLAILLAGLLTVATLGKNREIMAMRSIGITPSRIFRPILLCALIFSCLFTVINIFLIPKAENSASFILQMEIGKHRNKGIMIQGGQLYYRGKRSILSAQLLLPNGTQLSNVQWMVFDPNTYQLKTFIAAPNASYQGGKWHFFNGVMEYEGKTTFFNHLTKDLAITPQDLVSVEVPVEEASPSQLLQALKRLKELGLPYHTQEMVLLNDLLYPFLGLSLLYLCLPIAFYRLHTGIAAGLILGTLVAFAVWALWNMLISMGKTGTLPPLMAAFGPHLLLLSAGLWLRLRTKF